MGRGQVSSFSDSALGDVESDSQRGRVDRLANEVVRSRGQHVVERLRLLARGGDEDEGDSAFGIERVDAATDLEPVDAGQEEVEQNDVRCLVLEASQGVLAR